MTDYLWWRDGVIYQIYPRSFADSDGDGVGDLQGIIDKLDYLAGRPDSLGVDAIWLSPIYPSPNFDFGYDVSNYEDIDPLFGNLGTFDTLVAEAHKRGIRVVMDLVMNHTSHEHEWFQESRSSRDNPKRDWYIWKDPAPGGGPPNNWLACLGGGAWEWDEKTEQYYFHMFLPQQPDLNWRNPEVRARMWQMVRFWLDRGVDGFRLDVVNCYFKDAALRNNPYKLGIRPYDCQKHIHDIDQPEMHDAMRELRRLLDEYPERMAVGEILGDDPKIAASYCGTGSDQLHMAFNFHFTRRRWRPAAFQKAYMKWERALHSEAWPCNVLSNHDLDRHATRFGGGRYSDARARVAATMLLTLRGTPFLYYGEELGAQNTPIPRKEIVDPPGKRYWPLYKGRDPARAPMPWSGGAGAGFTMGQPWLRLPLDYRRRNVEAQRRGPVSIFQYYQRLISLRKRNPALLKGRWIPLERRPRSAWCYFRKSDEQTLLVALNFTEREAVVESVGELPSGHWRVLLSALGTGAAPIKDGRIVLKPFEALVCALEAAGE